jgi:hypothetical protein
MNCLNCSKNIIDKPFDHFKDIPMIDSEGNHYCSDAYTCSYRCYRELRETNKLPVPLWKHVVNREDYKDCIFPIIPKKKIFQYLTIEEINLLNDQEKYEYYKMKSEHSQYDQLAYSINEEILQEDIITSQIENEINENIIYSDDY